MSFTVEFTRDVQYDGGLRRSHREALFSALPDPDKFYAAAPYTFLIASVLVLIFGPGKFGLDTWIAARYSKQLGGCALEESPTPA